MRKRLGEIKISIPMEGKKLGFRWERIKYINQLYKPNLKLVGKKRGEMSNGKLKLKQKLELL